MKVVHNFYPAMKTSLTPQQIKDYQTQGFLIIDDFLTEDEINSIEQTVKEVVKNRQGKTLPYELKSPSIRAYEEGRNWLREAILNKNLDYEHNKVFTQLMNNWIDTPAFRDFALNKEIGQMVSQLTKSQSVRISHDQIIRKPAYGKSTEWHIDSPFWSFNNSEALTIWIALDDMTIQNGCLYYQPESHTIIKEKYPHVKQNTEDFFQSYPALKKLPSIPAEVKKGGCCIHNCLTSHGTGPNMSPYTRNAIAISFMPDGATFNGKQNTLSYEVISKLKIGDLLTEEHLSPVIYSPKERKSASK